MGNALPNDLQKSRKLNGVLEMIDFLTEEEKLILKARTKKNRLNFLADLQIMVLQQ